MTQAGDTALAFVYSQRRFVFNNWAHVYRCRPFAFYEPSTIAES